MSLNKGIFEFIDNALEAWPEGCKGAYICFFANPQNLDIEALLGSDVTESPFYRVLCCQPPPRVIMLANSSTPIHSRWWCILEAFLAVQQNLSVSIAGRPLELLTGALKDTLQLKERAAEQLKAEGAGEANAGDGTNLRRRRRPSRTARGAWW